MAGFGQDCLSSRPFKEAHPIKAFQIPDVFAHGWLTNGELFGCSTEAGLTSDEVKRIELLEVQDLPPWIFRPTGCFLAIKDALLLVMDWMRLFYLTYDCKRVVGYP